MGAIDNLIRAMASPTTHRSAAGSAADGREKLKPDRIWNERIELLQNVGGAGALRPHGPPAASAAISPPTGTNGSLSSGTPDPAVRIAWCRRREENGGRHIAPPAPFKQSGAFAFSVGDGFTVNAQHINTTESGRQQHFFPFWKK
jgi:hypothetical protein